MRAVPVVAFVVAAVLLAATEPSEAAWSGDGSGASAGRASVMPAGSQPAARVEGVDVTVSWPVARLGGGTAVGGYVVRRYDTGGNPVAVSADCAGTIDATTCIEHGVPPGIWTYTEAPVQDSWTGPTSPPSAPITVTGA